MGKILLHFDEIQYNRERGVFIDNLKVLNNISELYERLDIGRINIDRVKQILSGFIAGTEDEGNYSQIESDVCQNIEKAAKGNSYLLSAARKEADERLAQFKKEIVPLRKWFWRNQSGVYYVQTPLDWYQLTDGKFSINETTWDMVKDRCTNSINTPQEKKLYDAIQKLADAVNDVVEAIKPEIRPQLGGYTMLDLLTENADGSFTVRDTLNFKLLSHE
jgi:hypothetical protein